MDIATVMKKARSLGKCIPAFNIPHLPMLRPIAQAVVDTDSFAFIQVARVEWEKMSAKSLEAVAEEYHAQTDGRHHSLHLDHIPSIDEDYAEVDYMAFLRRAEACGFKSVMIDASRMGLEDNIRVTRQATLFAHGAGLACEAELGAVMGHESGEMPPYEEIFRTKQGFTDIDQARRFAAETECDWLSVACGNIHGAVSDALRNQKKPEARLDIEHIRQLYAAAGVPLVMHGGSGINRGYLLESFGNGITKINVGTEMRQAYEASLESSGDVEEAREAVYRKCVGYITDFLGNGQLYQELFA